VLLKRKKPLHRIYATADEGNTKNGDQKGGVGPPTPGSASPTPPPYVLNEREMRSAGNGDNLLKIRQAITGGEKCGPSAWPAQRQILPPGT
jgi:hypothetical protein